MVELTFPPALDGQQRRKIKQVLRALA